jgi:two-component system alkaline phosphatase synthesis response regulator PhoP
MAGKKKILVVDDNKLINTVVRHLLEANEFVVESAFDGQEALRKVATFKPHAVVLDVMMPKENGYRVSRLIKTLYPHLQVGRVPKVLLLTARRLDDDPEREAAVQQYSMADAVMYKPFDNNALLAKLRSFVEESTPARSTGT